MNAKASRLIGKILVWTLTVFLGVMFIFAGVAKIFNNPVMVQEFVQVGLGQWFRYFTGIMEMSGAIGLLIPRVRFWAALQIAAVMVGATIANLTVLHMPVAAPLTAVLLVLALTLAWLRRPRFSALPTSSSIVGSALR
jgi:putative oxidoreductase